jgi:outer membrane protein OmpA-like peptidoglycan-associated protein
MRIIIVILLLALTGLKSFGQTVYSDDQVIKISDYITELEKRDSLIKLALSGIDDKPATVTAPTATSSVKTINICGKLTGLNKTRFPITDITLMLVKENGEVISQKTANNGNFNFQNVDPATGYSLKISPEDTKVIEAGKLIIFDCKGQTVNTISKGMDAYDYKLTGTEQTQLSTEGTGMVTSGGSGGSTTGNVSAVTDPVAKINSIKTNYEKLKADTKACEDKVADLQKKFNELEKIFDALKSKPQDLDTDLQLYDGSLLAKYLKYVNFKTNDATLDEEAYKSLDALITQLKKFPKVKFIIYGHADNSGTDVMNMKLSQDRANVVKDYLASKKVDMKRFSTQAMGSAYPIANNEVEEGRAKNRRVEIKVGSGATAAPAAKAKAKTK